MKYRNNLTLDLNNMCLVGVVIARISGPVAIIGPEKTA
jgi:hypothetical protein